jgi:hypothetical protein
MAESSLSIGRTELLRYLGRELGYSRDTVDWDDRQRTDAEDILSSALRQFYTPPVLPGEATSHRWTFMRPIFSIATKGGVGDYDLPDDFGGIDGQLYYSSDIVGNGPMVRVGEQWVLNCRQGNVDITGYPTYYAVAPLPSDGDEPQRFTLMLEPIPDGVYELKGQYRVNPFALSENKSYPLGGQPHSETLISSAICACHKFLRDEYMGGAWADFMEKLKASVTHDRSEMQARNLGYASDTRNQATGQGYNRALLVTFEGSILD